MTIDDCFAEKFNAKRSRVYIRFQRYIFMKFNLHLGRSPMSPPIPRKVLRLFQHQFDQVPQDFQAWTPRKKEVRSCTVKGPIKYRSRQIKKIYQKLHVNLVPEASVKAIQQRSV